MCGPASQNSYPIHGQNLRFIYLWPDQKPLSVNPYFRNGFGICFYFFSPAGKGDKKVLRRGKKYFSLQYLFSGLVCLTVSPPVEGKTKTQSLQSILNHFTDTRNVYIDPVVKQRARDFIVSVFKDHGLHTWTEEFPSNQAKVNKE